MADGRPSLGIQRDLASGGLMLTVCSEHLLAAFEAIWQESVIVVPRAIDAMQEKATHWTESIAEVIRVVSGVAVCYC